MTSKITHTGPSSQPIFLQATDDFSLVLGGPLFAVDVHSADGPSEEKRPGLGFEDISRMAIATAVPLLPLLLTIFSAEDLIMRIVSVVF